MIAAYVLAVAVYSNSETFYDAAEPTIPAISAAYGGGAPLYHRPDAAERYTHVYGPILFIIHALALEFGDALSAPKLLSGSAAIAALLFLFRALSKRVTIDHSLRLLAVAAIVYLAFRHMSFWVRAEPALLLAIAAAIAALSSTSRPVAVVVCVLSCSFAIGLKVTGILYFLPIFAVLAERVGWRFAGAALISSLALAAWPFMIERISLRNYLFWLTHSGGRLINLSTLRANLDWAGILMVPMTLSAWRRQRPSRLVWMATMFSVAAVALIAAKPGAGGYHLLPFVPLIMFLSVEGTAHLTGAEKLERAVWHAFIGSMACIALLQQVYFWTLWSRAHRPGAADELHRVLTHYGAHRIEMGYGGDYRLTFLRPLLAYEQRKYFLDAPAVAEHALSGIPIPEATLARLRTCDPEIWLVPRSADPFDLRSPYSVMEYRHIFDNAFRTAFHFHYRRTERLNYYDVWTCRQPPGRR